MTRKRKRRSAIVEIGTGPAKVRIYTINRKDGYDQFTLAWKEGGRRRTRCFACIDEAKMVGQQVTVRLINGSTEACEATRRDIDLLAFRSNVQVATEFVESLKRKAVSDIYVRNATSSLKRFTDVVAGNIADVTVADINRFLDGLKKLGPVSKNGIRRNIVTMFGFAKKQGYLHPDRRTAAEQTDSFKETERETAIFTPDEMERLLLAAHAWILPLIAIGAFSGIRSAVILRLTWDDIKWNRGNIEIAGRKAEPAARRLPILPDNLKAWLAPWRAEPG